MREIRFRGKDNHGEWREGCYVKFEGLQGAIYYPIRHQEDGHVIRTDWCYVDDNTVGQFTGLHDKNGKDIYEGDIVVIRRTPEKRRIEFPTRHVVTGHSVSCWHFESLAKEVLSYCMSGLTDWDSYRFEVIGNIYDNPDLAQPYLLNLPEPKRRKQKIHNIAVEFVVADNPKSDPYVERSGKTAKVVCEMTQEQMNRTIDEMSKDQ